jgi:starch synthase
LPSSASKVLFATPECAPLVKTGGLGDVSAALPEALRAELGIDARVLLPGYTPVLDTSPGAREIARLTVLGRAVRLLESKLPSGVPLIIVDAPTLYARNGGPYQDATGTDWNDNALRFGVLSKVAALIGAEHSPLEWRPDVVQCNDWPTALAPLYLRFARGQRAATLLTIHNLAFQGIFSFDQVKPLELPHESVGLEGAEFYGKVSFLKGGIVYADAINTVSPTYAREIQMHELGFGLDGVLRQRAKDLHGVLNGIDTQAWDPRNDALIPSRYGPDTLDAKLANKRALKQRVGLGGPHEVPLATIVSRLAHQKGIDILVEAIPELAKIPVQVAVIGAGEREFVDQLRAAREKYPDTLGVYVGFDEQAAHLAEAGGDMFLMPSRFEPCGMNQMYSQRYGTPPVANATGGLIDTVSDGETGYLLGELTPAGLVAAVRRAVEDYRDPARWRRVQRNGMAQDFGWGAAARAYEAIYRGIRRTA